jgi:hypothetical protein
MDPFLSDVESLVASIRRVTSPAALRVLQFETDPRTAMSFDGEREREGLPQRRGPLSTPGAVVVVIGDLGIGVPRYGPLPAPPVAWREHHDATIRAGCHCIYLVPYPRERWPRWLAFRLPVVAWRDSLRADEVRVRRIAA